MEALLFLPALYKHNCNYLLFKTSTTQSFLFLRCYNDSVLPVHMASWWVFLVNSTFFCSRNKTKSMEPRGLGFAIQGVAFSFKNSTLLSHLDTSSYNALALLSLLINTWMITTVIGIMDKHTRWSLPSALFPPSHYNKRNTLLYLFWIGWVREK